jgi:hypothetical protein
VFRYLRSRGRPHHEAEDLTQEFFLLLIHEEVFRAARQEKGRFRSFILRILQRFLSDQGPARGRRQPHFEAGQLPFSAIPTGGEAGYEPPAACDPDAVFRQEWAAAVVADAVDQLQGYYVRAGQPEWFELFRAYRPTDCSPPASQEALGGRFGLTRDQVRYRLELVGARFEVILRRVISDEVGPDPDDATLRTALAGE